MLYHLRFLVHHLITAAALLLLYSSVASSEEERATVKIGVIGILSGPYSEVGNNIIDGIRLAQTEIANSPALPKVEIVVEDDQFSSREGVSALRKLLDRDKVDALINSSSVTFDAIYPIVSALSIPVMQLGEPGSDPQRDNVFFVHPPLTASSTALGNHFRTLDTPPDSIVLVESQLQAFDRLSRDFIAALGAPVKRYSVSNEETDFGTLALRILAQKPEHVVFFVSGAQGAHLSREMLRRPERPRFYFESSFLAVQKDYKEILGTLEPLANDVVSKLELHATEEFRQKFVDAYGREPGLLAELGYDALLTLASSYRAEQAEWLSSILSLKLSGASGEIYFTPEGQRRSAAEILRIGTID